MTYFTTLSYSLYNILRHTSQPYPILYTIYYDIPHNLILFLYNILRHTSQPYPIIIQYIMTYFTTLSYYYTIFYDILHNIILFYIQHIMTYFTTLSYSLYNIL